ncbi:2,5-diamino-6-(ribosylamino)-4(3H)-pyrimidinone 5'-phosphate reductase [Lobosporangium transversale]|uniref:2,5-diamino-6-ribosylamino-4(3H)-pyrimidinone 5'-phosphate reductase n=1 Tax=Lobosporangium transversale TaxID=64571 RepID=A0A1Y2GLC0_9FUNG|nr:5-amino-6-uracil reductase [Lobosporangium transversale]KAF9900888.1 2,5-diamino-6-(ribosylamino)-4(3H)-pyrimidinone 5'-phosphate reductase [Lobosporangium transversale]ORZ14359.1 5-amino-6-uracil reductase [Lobosporangium transversale]|eukprot:XP_021880837.1 5-amino-6-uracil reductase [Lobosporangium transversale]
MTNVTIPIDYNFLLDSSLALYKPKGRPHVTLTFAQSLDGKIAGKQGKQLTLSGSDSMKATHILRARHDTILVGIGTVLNDDPRLTVRLTLEDLPSGCRSVEHPQPVILDSTLRFPSNAKLLLPSSPKKPWIFTVSGHDHQKRAELEALGAKIFVLDADAQGRPSITHLLSVLHQQSAGSLMVEGGAGIISTFLKSGLVDSFLVTIAPVYVGDIGVSAMQDTESALKLDDISYHSLGRDVMIVAKPRRE